MMRANQPLISNCCLCRLCYNAAARCQSASHRYRDFQRHSPQNHPRHAVNTSLGLGGKCSQNPRNGYWTYKVYDKNAVRGSFLSLDIFSPPPPLGRPLRVHPNRNRYNLVHSATAAGFALVPGLSSFPVTQSLKRVPASAGLRAGMSPLPGGR